MHYLLFILKCVFKCKLLNNVDVTYLCKRYEDDFVNKAELSQLRFKNVLTTLRCKTNAAGRLIASAKTVVFYRFHK